jgi:hypothetical protein
MKERNISPPERCANERIETDTGRENTAHVLLQLEIICLTLGCRTRRMTCPASKEPYPRGGAMGLSGGNTPCPRALYVPEEGKYTGFAERDIRQRECHRKDMIYTTEVERRPVAVQILTASMQAVEIAWFGKYRVDEFLRRDLEWVVPCSHKG